MNVLLVGGSSNMMNAMIDRFRKDNHRIYLLTGRKDRSVSYKHVFERYDFSYDDDSIKDIMESARPDLVVFLGAYDINFDWYHRGQQESVRYTTSLLNILSAYAMIEKGRFVYLSSQEVYSGSYGNPVPEEEPVEPKGHKALAVAQGEEICSNYRRNAGVDVVILRLDHVYSVPGKGREESSSCFRMCLEAIKTGRISASERNIFSMLFLNDAVELSYKVMVAEKALQNCYHISSMEEISETQLAGMIRKEMGPGVELADTTAGEGRRLVLNGSCYQAEFGQKIFVPYEEGVKRVVQYIKRYRDSFIRAEDSGGSVGGKISHKAGVIFKSLLPFLENLVCFVPFYLLYSQAAGSRYFERLDFFLLYVLLFAVVHGQQQAIVSAVFSVIGYFFRQTYGRSGFEVLLDYNTYVWTAQLFIVGMVVGYMRDRLHHITDDKEEEIRYLQERIDSISDINDSNVRMKRNFEAQLVNQKDSLGKIYEVTSSLEKYGPEEVLFYAAKVLGDLMNSRDTAVYVVANEEYARLFSASSEKARSLGSSIAYSTMDGMYGALKEKRVFINKEMDETLPLMASAVYEEDKMQLIFMIWGIPWQRMTLAEANRLTVIGALIQNASVRARRYLDMLKERRYLEGTEILNQEAFSQLVKAFLEAKDQGLTECTLLEVMLPDRDYIRASAALKEGIRTTDYLGMLEDGKLYALLSNTKEENAVRVAERFRKAGYESRTGRGQ